MKRLSFCAALALVLGWSTTALADAVEITYMNPAASAAPPADKPAEPLAATPAPGRPRYDLFRISLGPRVDYVTSSGFDSFAKNDVLANFSIDGTVPVLTRGKLTLGVGVGWTFAGRSDGIRGAETKLTVHRLQVPIEARFHVLPSVFAFAKVAPGAAAMRASVTESSSPNTLEDTAWAFSADVSIGAGILLGPRTYEGDKRAIRIWAIPEIGYGFTTKSTFDLRPDREAKDALGTDERTTLAALSLSAVFWRLSLATTF